MESDASKGGVGNGATAEGEVQLSELGTAEGEDFSGGVGEGAAEGLVSELVGSRMGMYVLIVSYQV